MTHFKILGSRCIGHPGVAAQRQVVLAVHADQHALLDESGDPEVFGCQGQLQALPGVSAVLGLKSHVSHSQGAWMQARCFFASMKPCMWFKHALLWWCADVDTNSERILSIWTSWPRSHKAIYAQQKRIVLRTGTSQQLPRVLVVWSSMGQAPGVAALLILIKLNTHILGSSSCLKRSHGYWPRCSH